MRANFRRWFKIPDTDGDEEKKQLSRQFYIILVTLIAVATLSLPFMSIVLPESAMRWVFLYGSIDLVCLGLLGLAQRGHIRAACIFLVLLLGVIITVAAPSAGGIHAPVIYSYIIIVFIAGLLLGAKAGIVTAVACSLMAFGLVVAEWVGLLPSSIIQHTEISLWAILTLLLIVTVGLQYLAVSSVKQSLQKAKKELAERNQAEEASRATTLRLTALLEHMQMGILFEDHNRHLTLVNQVFCDLFGIAALPQALVGKNCEDMAQSARLLMADPEGFVQRIETILTEKQLVTSEEIELADGRFFERDYIPISINAQISGHLWQYRNISERKQAEAALYESEEKYRGLVQGLPDAIAIYINGKIVFANAASVELMRASRVEDLLGRPILDMVHPDFREFVMERMLKAQKEGIPLALAEEKFIRLDGTPVDVEVKATPITFDHKPAVQLIVRDSTERQRMAEAVKQSELKYRRIVETANEGVVALDSEQCLTLVNEQMAAMLGYPVKEMLGRKMDEFISEEELSDHRRQMELSKQGLGATYERCFRRKDGARVWTIISTTATMDVGGCYAGAFGMVTDITARKQAEAEISRMALMLDVAPNAITVYGFDGRPLYANQRTFDLHGYPRDEFMAKTLHELTVPTSSQLIAARMKKLLEQREIGFQAEHFRKDGSTFPLEVNARVTRWGDIDAILSIDTDITERRHAEQALLESEARFRALVGTANDAIITMDMRGTIVSWNGAAEQIFGYTEVEAIQMPVSQIVPETFGAQPQRGVERMFAGNDGRITSGTIEAAGLARNGRKFPIEMSLAEWKTQSGQFFTAIIRDVSERKQRERELQAISSLSAALRTAPTRAEMLPVIVEQLGNLLECDAISIEMIDPNSYEAVVEAAFGRWSQLVGFRQPPGTGLNAIIAETRRFYYNNNLQQASDFGYPSDMNERIGAGAGVPLIAQDRLIGFLWMGRQKEINMTEVRLLSAVADMAANALHRATLHEQTQKNAADLMLAYDTTLEGWAHVLELRDQETEGHTRRVVQMTVNLARAMGVDETNLENVRRGALLHDIGKMGIPDSVLFNPGTLNEREWEIMRQHPDYAYKFLKPIEYLNPALDIPYCHHEKWDGSGYPRGLKGEAIPLVARIFAIVDVWEALRSDRRYRDAWPVEKVRSYILEQSGRHFDPRVVQAFMALLENDHYLL